MRDNLKQKFKICSKLIKEVARRIDLGTPLSSRLNIGAKSKTVEESIDKMSIIWLILGSKIECLGLGLKLASNCRLWLLDY